MLIVENMYQPDTLDLVFEWKPKSEIRHTNKLRYTQDFQKLQSLELRLDEEHSEIHGEEFHQEHMVDILSQREFDENHIFQEQDPASKRLRVIPSFLKTPSRKATRDLVA